MLRWKQKKNPSASYQNQMINAISGGRGLFIYSNDEYYRNHSKYIPKTQ